MTCRFVVNTLTHFDQNYVTIWGVSHTTLSSRFALAFLQNNAVCLKKKREKEKFKIKIDMRKTKLWTR